MDCLFCKIVNKEINSFIIYEDDLVLAFLDAFPDSPGHTLVVPKKHFKDITDIDTNTLNHIIEIGKNIKSLLEEKLGCTGISFMQNNGTAQEIKHFHLHIKPCYNENKPNLSKEEVYKILTSK